MSRKSLAATFAALFVTVITGAAFAGPPASDRVDAAEHPAKLPDVFMVLHAVGQWSIDLSTIAEKNAKSSVVKDYAHEMATSNTDKDAQLMALAQKHGIAVAQPDPQTPEGKSLLDRMKAETVLLNSLQGDAFDKEYMTLVTNTQQSMIHFLEARKATAKDPDVKQFMVNMITVVQNRLQRAQKIMATVYGNNI
jgi:predicted outer membrane protein